MILFIDGETPAKKNANKFNAQTKSVYKNKHYSDWYRSAKNIVRYQILRHEPEFELPINQEVRIKMTFTHGDMRRRDSDNGTSSILDLLTDSEVLADDNWKIVKELCIQNEYVKGKPSCKVEIELL